MGKGKIIKLETKAEREKRRRFEEAKKRILEAAKKLNW